MQSIWHAQEAEFSICEDCYRLICEGRLPWSFVLMFWRMRGQIATLAHEVTALQNDVQKLYRSNQDITEMLGSI